jgi:hypothetical protein
MHRTEGANHINNLFTNGPPSTCIEQNWLNAVQEEIAYVIEQASITLLTADTDTRRQLYQAISASSGISCNDPDYPMLINSQDNYLDLDSVGSSWETVGPTGSGATHLWTLLDNIPNNVEIIRIRVCAFGDTDESTGSTILNYRPYGSSVSATVHNRILSMISPTGGKSYLAEHTVQLGTGKMFELNMTSKQHTNLFYGRIFIVGYKAQLK